MDDQLIPVTQQEIENRIYTIRDTQVMLDNHLSELYGVETKQLNQAVKRNMERFPEAFMFQLTGNEWDSLRSQIAAIYTLSAEFDLRSQFVTSKNLRFQVGTSSSKHGGRRYLPFAFTEQGVAMLSAVLRSETAVKVSVQIMNAFVEMRKFMIGHAALFQRFDHVERRLLKVDEQFARIFKTIKSGDVKPDKGIFFDGQVFDAYVFVSGLIRNAQKSIILIDNWVDESVLIWLAKRNKGVIATIYTQRISKQLALDLEKYNTQYEPVKVREFKLSHDRFLIIDQAELYHLGASFKDLGKKWFAFSKMDAGSLNLMNQLNEII
jgi:hypothetical protein